MLLWTDFYASQNAGGTWVNNNNLNSTTQLLIPNPDTVSFYKAMVLSSLRDLSNSLGFIGAGQIGYNWQVTVSGLSIVTGIEADIQAVAGWNGNVNFWSYNANDHYGTANFPNFDNNGYSNTKNLQSKSSLNLLGTVCGRLGFLLTPSLVVYGTGGLAYGAMI